MAQWRYKVVTDKLSAAMQFAERVQSLAEEKKESAPLMGACRALAGTFFFSGDFEAARKHVVRGVEILHSGGAPSYAEFLDAPAVVCLCYEALSKWHFGEMVSCGAAITEAISLARELNDMGGLAAALNFAAMVAHFNRDTTEVESLASDLIELAIRYNFPYWLALGTIWRGWACSVFGGTAQGISLIAEGIEAVRAAGVTIAVPLYLTVKAEALHLADRTSEALEAIKEAEVAEEKNEERFWSAELHRLRGVFLAAIGADEAQIEASFQEAIRIAREQKSVSLEKRAEATYAEYRRQKANVSGGRGFRLPLW
jgi:predicted ATPase